jgi:ferredoxin/flavodoxin---NADP+ reductase
MSASDEKFYHPRITHRVDLTPTLWTFRVRIEEEEDFKFSPGQYATLGLTDQNGKRWERPYSIVSAPFEREIEFFLEQVPDGDVSPRLYDLKIGDELLMRKAVKGRFTLDTQSGRTNHLLICTVTGVAPFVSYVRTFYKQWKEGRSAGQHKLFLLNGASLSCEFGYLDELQKFAQEIPWFQYVPTISRPWNDAAWSGETGRVDDIIRKYADMWSLNGANTIAYMCGNPGMIEHGKAILMRVGFKKEFLKEEFYWVPAKHAA